MLKRIVTIQDISCFGKCSLTVALPVISAMGVETAVIPTAVLSTHTTGFTGYTFRDLTADIPQIAAHWKNMGLTFDGIYTFEVFSFYETDENDKYFMTNFASGEAFLTFCDRAISRSQYDTGITMTADDIMITLSTCVNLSPTGRYACHARLIKIEN